MSQDLKVFPSVTIYGYPPVSPQRVMFRVVFIFRLVRIERYMLQRLLMVHTEFINQETKLKTNKKNPRYSYLRFFLNMGVEIQEMMEQ